MHALKCSIKYLYIIYMCIFAILNLESKALDADCFGAFGKICEMNFKFCVENWGLLVLGIDQKNNSCSVYFPLR